ncbi:hypothetical protein N9N67_09540 [Bacteriovoracaceae bacterium]|nr:hypothetical protein [Bacteriovoracaceae bacterium]
MKITFFLILFFVTNLQALTCKGTIPNHSQIKPYFELGRYTAFYFAGKIKGILCATNPGSYEEFSKNGFKFYYQDDENREVESFTMANMKSVDGVNVLDKKDLKPIFRPMVVNHPIVKFNITQITPYGSNKAKIIAVFDFAVNLSKIFSRYRREQLTFEAIFDFNQSKVLKYSLYPKTVGFQFDNFDFHIKGTKIKSIDLKSRIAKKTIKF